MPRKKHGCAIPLHAEKTDSKCPARVCTGGREHKQWYNTTTSNNPSPQINIHQSGLGELGIHWGGFASWDFRFDALGGVVWRRASMLWFWVNVWGLGGGRGGIGEGQG